MSTLQGNNTSSGLSSEDKRYGSNAIRTANCQPHFSGLKNGRLLLINSKSPLLHHPSSIIMPTSKTLTRKVAVLAPKQDQARDIESADNVDVTEGNNNSNNKYNRKTLLLVVVVCLLAIGAGVAAAVVLSNNDDDDRPQQQSQNGNEDPEDIASKGEDPEDIASENEDHQDQGLPSPTSPTDPDTPSLDDCLAEGEEYVRSPLCMFHEYSVSKSSKNSKDMTTPEQCLEYCTGYGTVLYNGGPYVHFCSCYDSDSFPCLPEWGESVDVGYSTTCRILTTDKPQVCRCQQDFCETNYNDVACFTANTERYKDFKLFGAEMVEMLFTELRSSSNRGYRECMEICAPYDAGIFIDAADRFVFMERESDYDTCTCYNNAECMQRWGAQVDVANWFAIHTTFTKTALDVCPDPYCDTNPDASICVGF